ncbi:hypothetical protein RJ639_029722, partial [Escallonia herrerae]
GASRITSAQWKVKGQILEKAKEWNCLSHGGGFAAGDIRGDGAGKDEGLVVVVVVLDLRRSSRAWDWIKPIGYDTDLSSHFECCSGSSVRMRTVAMCFSLLQIPRYRINSLASSCWESFHTISRTPGYSPRLKILGCSNYDLEGGYSRRWIRRPVSTKTGGTNKNSLGTKTSNIGHEILDDTISSSTKCNLNKLGISELGKNQHCDSRQKIDEIKDLARNITFIVFDIETTGFSSVSERIIEIALQDLAGGDNSIFQTLINPERYVPNSYIHGISTSKVNRPDVPKMKDFIPILLQYVRSRQKPGGEVVFIAHNARRFDVPFLVREFSRCNFEIPLNWLFVDTLPLARDLLKSGGLKLPSKTSLQALVEYYDVPLVGSAHRAMSDVHALSLVLQRLTYDLKLPVSGLLEGAFRASELNNPKTKKSR